MSSLAPLLRLCVFAAPALSADAFEVASVKVNESGGPGGSMRSTPGGRFEATNSTMRALLRFAYNVRDFQIESAPSWFDSVRYDIVAKAPASASTAEFRVMVQKLLAERFALAFRRETKSGPAFALKTGKGGPKMKPNAEGDISVASGQGEIRAQKITMRMLANQLATVLGHPVLDQTGLDGTFDVTLQWAPDATPPGDGPSIFAAVEEQLGLRLDSARAPVEALIIQSASKTPAGN